MQRRGDLVSPVLRGHHGRRHLAQKALQPLPVFLPEMIQAASPVPTRDHGCRPALEAILVVPGKPEPCQPGSATQIPKVFAHS